MAAAAAAAAYATTAEDISHSTYAYKTFPLEKHQRDSSTAFMRLAVYDVFPLGLSHTIRILQYTCTTIFTLRRTIIIVYRIDFSKHPSSVYCRRACRWC